MSAGCRICRHWVGEIEQEGHHPGQCRRDPTPVETMSNYRCGALSVEPEAADHWFWHAYWYYKPMYYAERASHAKTRATLDIVRNRHRAARKRVEQTRKSV